MSLRFPVPPGVVVRVVQAAADPDTTVADLSRILETDPALSTQVLRCVNSACFGLRNKVASVERAITLMGMRAVRNLALSVGVRGLVPSEQLGEFPLEVFWEHSLRRASAAQCLAEGLELGNVEEFFTLGLCQDVGLLVRLLEHAELATRMAEVLRQPAGIRLEIERNYGESHDRIGHAMFAAWSFPEELTAPLLYHHDPDAAPEAHRQRARVACAAEAIADFSMVDDKRLAMQTAVQALEAIGLDGDALRPCVDRVNELVEAFAALIGLELDDQPSSEEIMAMAYEGLAELNLTYEELNRRLQDSLAEQQRMADKLKSLNAELERQAHTDALTGLANRRSFDAALDRELAVAERQGSPISLLIFDVDRFKQLNDTQGHQAGDRVLQRIGHMLCEQVRTTDLAARYGGEEFALILPFTDRAGAEIAADRFRQSVEELGISWAGEELHVTVSVGGATLDNVQHPWIDSVDVLLCEADRAMYAAKHAGRNTVRWAESLVGSGLTS